jgi:hypothetical protein
LEYGSDRTRKYPRSVFFKLGQRVARPLWSVVSALCHPAVAFRTLTANQIDGFEPSGNTSFSEQFVNGATQRCPMPSNRRQWEDALAYRRYSVIDGGMIHLTGLGILTVQKRAARMGRNPATGESIEIAASRKIPFRPSKD